MIHKKILITPEYYIGLEEWYMKVFECPKCGTKSPIGGTKYCRYCGCDLVFSQTVRERDSKAE